MFLLPSVQDVVAPPKTGCHKNPLLTLDYAADRVSHLLGLTAFELYPASWRLRQNPASTGTQIEFIWGKMSDTGDLFGFRLVFVNGGAVVYNFFFQ